MFYVSPGPWWEFHLVKLLNLHIYQVQEQGKAEKCLEEDKVSGFEKDWAKTRQKLIPNTCQVWSQEDLYYSQNMFENLRGIMLRLSRLFILLF